MSAVIFVEQGIVRGVIVVIFFVLYQQLENHILQPVIYGRTVQLSPLAVLVAVLIGAELAGVLGALMAIPVAGSVQAIVRELLLAHRERLIETPPGAAPCSERLGLVERLDAGDPVEEAVVARQAVEAEAAVDVVVRPVVALENVVPGPSEEDVLARVTLITSAPPPPRMMSAPEFPARTSAPPRPQITSALAVPQIMSFPAVPTIVQGFDQTPVGVWPWATTGRAAITSAVAMKVSPASRNRSEMVASRNATCRSCLSHRSPALRRKSPNGWGVFAGARQGKEDAVWIRRLVIMWLARRAWRLVQRTRPPRGTRRREFLTELPVQPRPGTALRASTPSTS